VIAADAEDRGGTIQVGVGHRVKGAKVVAV
jgi:hypothetical protein